MENRTFDLQGKRTPPDPKATSKNIDARPTADGLALRLNTKGINHVHQTNSKSGLSIQTYPFLSQPSQPPHSSYKTLASLCPSGFSHCHIKFTQNSEHSTSNSALLFGTAAELQK